ncbi:MAG TPA: acyltransferase, partial [Actinomycetota bacterium]|nr:acyltransferase [Actinomycetota bacterium]
RKHGGDPSVKDFLARFHRRVHDYEDRKNAPRFGSVGPGSLIRMPSMFLHPERLFVGRDSTIHPYCRMEIITDNPHLEGPPLPERDARIEIGDRVVINAFSHFGAMERIVLGNDVGIASGVCIEDHHYEYEHATDARPLKKQPFRVAPVVIEDGAMIGEHVTILAGVTIGANSWIGANSVVTKDVPPYSIAAGVPARVVRRRNASGAWERVAE